jgi:hypothetical protein
MPFVAACLKWTARPGEPRTDERFAGVSEADRSALEIALRLADRLGAEVVVAAVGPDGAEVALRDAVAAAATRAVRVDASEPMTSAEVARQLRGVAGATVVVAVILTDRGAPVPASPTGSGWRRPSGSWPSTSTHSAFPVMPATTGGSQPLPFDGARSAAPLPGVAVGGRQRGPTDRRRARCACGTGRDDRMRVACHACGDTRGHRSRHKPRPAASGRRAHQAAGPHRHRRRGSRRHGRAHPPRRQRRVVGAASLGLRRRRGRTAR